MKLKGFYKFSLKFVCVLMAIIVCSFSFPRDIDAEPIVIEPDVATESLRVCEYNYLTNTETEYDITIRVDEIQTEPIPPVSENTIAPAAIVPPDTSSLIDSGDYSSYPHSAICRIVSSIGSGTAFLVKNRIALTSAHCVISSGSWGTNAYVMAHPYAGATQSYIVNNGSRVIKAIIPKQYKTTSSNNYDWAILVLEDNLGSANGTFTLSTATPSVNQDAYIYGYDDAVSGFNMRFSPGYYLAIYTDKLHYTCDTTQGMSGSPVVNMVYVNGALTYPVYAIHHGGSSSYNIGVRINRFIIEKVRSLNTQYT